MSQPVIVSTLQNRARVLAGLAPFTANTTVSLADALEMAKASFEELGSIAKEYTDEQLLSASGTVPTQAGLGVVSMPTHFSDLSRVSWLRAANDEVPIDWAGTNEFFSAPQGGTSSPWSSYGGGIKARLIGPNSLELFPAPDAVYTLKLYYTTGIYVVTAADTVVMRDGWSRWIVYDLCVQFRMAQQKTGEDLSPASFIAQRDAVEQRIRHQMQRDRNRHRHIQDRRGGVTAALGLMMRRRRF